jgi:hypothetical protein
MMPIKDMPAAVSSVVAQKMDDSPRIVDDWRNFFRWNSVRWNISGFLVAFGYSAGLAAMSVPFFDVKEIPHILVGLAIAGIFLGSLYSRLRVQHPPDDEDDKNDQHA